jgi:hypothetical protein
MASTICVIKDHKTSDHFLFLLIRHIRVTNESLAWPLDQWSFNFSIGQTYSMGWTNVMRAQHDHLFPFWSSIFEWPVTRGMITDLKHIFEWLFRVWLWTKAARLYFPTTWFTWCSMYILMINKKNISNFKKMSWEIENDVRCKIIC